MFIVQLRNVLFSEGNSYSVLSLDGCNFRVAPWTLVEFKLLYISAAQMRIRSSFFRCPAKLPPFSCACILEIEPGELEGHFFLSWARAVLLNSFTLGNPAFFEHFFALAQSFWLTTQVTLQIWHCCWLSGWHCNHISSLPMPCFLGISTVGLYSGFPPTLSENS